MKKIIKKVSTQKAFLFSTIATTLATASAPSFAASGNSLGSVSTGITSQFQQVGNLVIAGSFLGGVGLTAFGLKKLKDAADSGGQQVKYGEGIWRLGVGAGLMALPAVAGVGVGTFIPNGAVAPNMGTATFTN